MSTETMDSSTQTCDDPQPGSGPDGFTCPRVEIDTSAPFRSVEEAVIRFGGRGFWIPRHLLPSPPSDESEEVDIYKIEEDLDTKQQATLDILKELELTKRFIDRLKLKLHKEASEFQIQEKRDRANDEFVKSVNCSNLCPLSPAGLVILELKQAKQNLSKSTNDLEVIRASIEQVNKRVEKKKSSLQRAPSAKLDHIRASHGTSNEAEMLGGNTSPLGVSRELRELNYEAEQFMKTAEAAKGEVLRAMSEIEQTKTGLKMIEMRWVAAKKMEEAAKAAEALALAEIKALSTNDTTLQKPGRISLSFEEYASLAEKARKAESIEIANRRNPAADPPQFRDFFRSQRRKDSTLDEVHETVHGNAERKPAQRATTTSIGDILSRKLVMRDDLDIGRQRDVRGDGQRVSLNQMLDRHRTGTPPRRRAEESNAGGGGGGDSKGFFSKRKALGFIHISLPLSKQSKNRIQALNLW